MQAQNIIRDTDATFQTEDGVWHFKIPCVTVAGEGVESVLPSRESTLAQSSAPPERLK